ARELHDAVERYLDGDRDLERRRSIAAQHVAKAARAQVLAKAKQSRGEDGQAERTEATREVMLALALDPAQADAMRMLVQLLTEVPEKMPVEVEAEIEQ